jgi:hypothetical protein
MPRRSLAAAAFLWTICALAPSVLRAQSSPSSAPDEIPIERCDRLPVVKAHVGAAEVRFLLDTGATTTLNLKSFSGGQIKEIHVTSWTGTAATSAREVSIRELSIGNHHLRDLTLPAIDLSPIGNACGGPIDGILGVDLLDKIGATIDLKRQVAALGVPPADPRTVYDEMEKSMGPCLTDFEQGKAQEFDGCLDPDVVLYTPDEEFRGKKQVMEYFQRSFFRFAPNVHYSMDLKDVQIFGDALWYSYDYVLETPEHRHVGHGMAMCRKSEGRWRMLNMHNSVPPSTPAPGAPGKAPQ